MSDAHEPIEETVKEIEEALTHLREAYSLTAGWEDTAVKSLRDDIRSAANAIEAAYKQLAPVAARSRDLRDDEFFAARGAEA